MSDDPGVRDDNSAVDRRPRWRLSLSPVSWVLTGYAALLCIGMWGYAILRIESDATATLDSQRERLRSISVELEAQVESMLGDGVGAAIAAANELDANTTLDQASITREQQTLAHMLTGGNYIRSLFLASPTQFLRVGRSPALTALPASLPPGWLSAAFTASADSWAGVPLPDPDNPGHRVVPVARRLGHGAQRNWWAGALFEFGVLDSVYKPTDSGSAVGIFSKTGVTELLVPEVELGSGEGRDVASSDLFRRAAQGPAAGFLEGISPFTHLDAMVAYQSVNGYPLFVEASRRRAETLAAWNERRSAWLWLASAVTALIIVTTTTLDHFLRALRRRQAHYRTLFNNAAFAAFLLDGERFAEVNRTAASMFDVDSSEELVGMRPWDVSPATQHDGKSSEVEAREHIQKALQTGAVSFEWTHQRLKDGKPFCASVDLSSIDADGHIMTLAVVHNINQRKLLDEERDRVVNELHELAGTLVHIQDDERRRIGRELHDSIGQTMAALELDLSRLSQTTAGSLVEQLRLLHQCIELARRCSSELRTASYLLHPPLLDEIGLLSALRWLADGLRQRSGIEISLELPDTMERLAREQELAIFRVAQEALTNVLRHSKSPSVTIRLFDDGAHVTLEIEDAGHGILANRNAGRLEDVSALGVGLAGMRERMRQLGGTLTVRTGPTGTCVQARLSLSDTAKLRAARRPAGHPAAS